MKAALDAKLLLTYAIESSSLGIAVLLLSLQLRLFFDRALDEVLIHNSDEGIILIESKLGEEALPNLVDVAHEHRGEENFGEGNAGV